ncbi:hypothetical protein [Marivivens sp. JLT3646]|uniref:hypothetical protein n=1 Tax=Marivivens sp. JLT3646 TaxID=1920883 RepID=UPI000AFFE871|nr:hypothetical protein [Marivivens sp. JLT3646]
MTELATLNDFNSPLDQWVIAADDEPSKVESLGLWQRSFKPAPATAILLVMAALKFT